MPNRVVYFNGKHVPESQARVSIFDSALMYGDMAFEMTRTFGGKPFQLRAHIDRLFASLKLMDLDCGMTADEMEAVTIDTLARNKITEPEDVDWQIMHDVSPGPLEIYEPIFPEGTRPTVSINCWPMIRHLAGSVGKYDEGFHLVIPAQPALPAHLLDAKAKTRSRLHYHLANMQASRMGAGCLPVLLDPDGLLTEGTGYNVLLVKNGVLLSPEPRNMLRGVSRDVTLQIARELGIEVVEANLDRYDALQADEIVCTATSFCICHAATFEAHAVGDGRPGPIYQQLLKGWNQRVGIDIVAQARDYAGREAAWIARERAAQA